MVTTVVFSLDTTGMWIVAGVGFLAVTFSLLVSFFPPTQLLVGNPVIYVVLVAAGLVVFVSAALMIFRFRKPSWSQGLPGQAPHEASFASTAPSMSVPVMSATKVRHR